MKFERGIGVKRGLGLGLSFDNLQRGGILKIKKGFSTDRWGSIQGHKCRKGKYLVIKSDPYYNDRERVNFLISQAVNLDHAQRIQKSVLKEDNNYYSWGQCKITDMSRLQFNRRLEVVG